MKKMLLLGLTLVFAIPVMSQNSANLKMSLEKNKVYRLKSHSEQTINQTVNGNQQTVDSKTNYTISLKMIDATANFLIAEVHFDTLISITNSMGKIININSTVEGNIASSEMADVMSCIMNRLSKNAIYVKIDFTGKPVEIINGKMMSEMVLKDTSAITLTGPTATSIKQQIANAVSDGNLKTMIGEFTWNLPGKQISAGDNWSTTQQTNSGGMALDITTTCHLEKINGNNAIVTAEAKIKAAENAAPIQSGGATVTYDNLQGLSKANLVIDVLTGLIIEDKSETHISGNLGISAPGVSMQMPMDIKGESVVTALK